MKAFFGIHILLSCLCFAYGFKKNRQEGLFLFSVILFLPVLGCLLGFCLWRGDQQQKKVDPTAALFYGDRGYKTARGSLKKTDVNRELNLIPMEEALLFNSIHIKRKMMLDLLKDDMGKYPEVLKMALHNQDSETSHYAATAIVELRSKMILSLQEWENKYKTQERDQYVLFSYVSLLRECLKSNILDRSNHNKAKETYRFLFKRIVDVFSLEEKYYIDEITYDIEAGDYLSAEFYCQRFMHAYPRSQEPYLLYLKLYYLLGDHACFNTILEKIEDSAIVLTSNAWAMIKFWN